MTNIEKIKAEIERRIELEQQNIDEYIDKGCEGDPPVTSEAIKLTLQGLLLFVNGLEKEDLLANIPHWKPAARAYEGDRLPRIDFMLKRLVARAEDGCYYLNIDELYTLPKETK